MRDAVLLRGRQLGHRAPAGLQLEDRVVAEAALASRRGGTWRNTQETAWSLLALDEYRKAQEKVAPDFTARVFLGEGEIFSAGFHGRTLEQPKTTLPAANLVAAAGAPLAFDVEGQGKLFYEARLRYAPKTLPKKPIERGFFVAQVDRRFDLVTPKRNTATVVAHIIASLRPRSLLSYDNVVFLDVGEGKGIEPGNRFFVVRRGDEYLRTLDSDPEDIGTIQEIPEYHEEVLPKEVVAELRVVKVRKNTTIALVIRSDTDIFLGDVAELRPGF